MLRSEIDASGYDIVLECNGILRHIQLKTSGKDAKTASQKINVALATKPSGCVVWIVRHEENYRMQLSYLFFGADAGQRLQLHDDLKVGKHTKGNKDGVKAERPSIRVIPKKRFKEIKTTTELVTRLFNLKTNNEEVTP